MSKKVKILVPIAENKYGLSLTMKSETIAELKINAIGTCAIGIDAKDNE